MTSQLTLDVADDLVAVDKLISSVISSERRFKSFVDSPASSLKKAGLIAADGESGIDLLDRVFFDSLTNTKLIEVVSDIVEDYKPDEKLKSQAKLIWKAGLSGGKVSNMPDLEFDFLDHMWSNKELSSRLLNTAIVGVHESLGAEVDRRNISRYVDQCIDLVGKGAGIKDLPYLDINGNVSHSRVEAHSPDFLATVAVVVVVAVAAVAAEVGVAFTVTVARAIDDWRIIYPPSIDSPRGGTESVFPNGRDSLINFNSKISPENVKAIETLSKLTTLSAALSLKASGQ